MTERDSRSKHRGHSVASAVALLAVQLAIALVATASVVLGGLTFDGCSGRSEGPGACNYALGYTAEIVMLAVAGISLVLSGIGSFALGAKGRARLWPTVLGISLTVIGAIVAHSLLATATH